MKTGYEDWDQNLKTLGGALFPDPSKQAHAYYYGTEARNALLKSAQTQESLAAGHRLTGMIGGDFQPPTYGPGPLGVNILQDPYAGGAPAAASAAPALGAVVAGGPAAVGNAIVAGVENHTQTGPVPPVQSPAPNAGAAPAPTTTGSDGSTPQNGPGNLAPGSVTSAGGGGVIRSGPAAANGSPAPLNFDFARVMDMGAKSGLTADQMQVLARSTLANMEKNGQMATPQVEALAALFGAPQMRVQTQTNEGNLAVGAQTQAGATQRTAMEQAGATQRTGMTEAGATQRTGMALQDIVAPNDPTQITRVPLAQLQGPGGTPSYNPNAVTAGVAPVTVQPAGPGTSSYSQPAFRAQQPQGGQPGMPVYQPGTEDIRQTQQGAVGIYTTAADPTRRVSATAGQAIAGGLVPVPPSQDQQAAMLDDAILHATGDEKQRLINARLQLAALPKGPVDPAKAFEQMQVNYEADQMAYPQPDPIAAVDMTVKAPVAFTPAAETAIADRVKSLRNTAKGYVLNETEARNEARRQLQDEGVLYTPDEINNLRKESVRSLVGRDIRIQTYKPAGQPASEHMMVGLKPKTAGAAGTTTTTTTPPISTVIPRPEYSRPGATPAAPAAGAPAGAIGAARPGTPDGPATIGGKPVVVRGGYIFPG
jgi:hypothetical protein